MLEMLVFKQWRLQGRAYLGNARVALVYVCVNLVELTSPVLVVQAAGLGAQLVM